jgi:hypothetical protein
MTETKRLSIANMPARRQMSSLGIGLAPQSSLELEMKWMTKHPITVRGL